MAGFLHDDLLLSSDTARQLYHEVAAPIPIIDVHTHLPVEEISANRVFGNLTELWLEGDHYKWRAMRQAGFEEQVVTGGADPWDRFAAWAATVPRLIGNPLYVWTHLELRRVFGIDVALSPATAREVWEEADRQLPGWPVRRLLGHFKVSMLATTDDPADDLDGHRQMARSYGEKRVVPTWRPDRAHKLLDDPPAWNAWADQLAEPAGAAVDDLESLLEALTRSYRRFAALGCRASDHGLEFVPDQARDDRRADRAVREIRNGRPADDGDRAAVLLEVVHLAAGLAQEEDAVLQLHLGARRDASPRLRSTVGPDAGGDAIGDYPQGAGLARLLAELETAGRLPRTVLYNANPRDNALFASLAGAFSRPGVTGLVQWGPPWWFNDHERGIRRQLQVLAEVGQLAGFVGMLTDSRSVLSMTRHELFRRILCDLIGQEADQGRIPGDRAWLSGIVSDVCAGNTARFFGMPAPEDATWE